MGILSKITKPKGSQELTVEDLKFLLSKMRIATYTGDEFEHFYNVWVKLTETLHYLESKKGT